MKTFLHVNDLGPLDKALAEAAEIKIIVINLSTWAIIKRLCSFSSITLCVPVCLPKRLLAI